MIPKSAEAVQALIMRAGIVVNVTRADRLRLEAIVADRSQAQKRVWRANVILAAADGCGTAEIMRRSGKSKPVVWTWQARFMAEGVEGLLRHKTPKPRQAPPPPHTLQRAGDWACVRCNAAWKHPKVQKWLARHPRWTFHFTPTSASWLNAVEGFFAKLTR